MDITYAGLLGVAIVALLAPILVSLAPKLRLPAVALEILVGILVGPALLGWVEVDTPVEVISTIGLGYLLFLAGMELDLDAVRRFLRPISGGFGFSCVLALVVGGLIHLTDASDDALFLAIVLVATSLSLVMPVLTEARLSHTTFGQVVMGSASLGEFASLLLLSVFFSQQSSRPGAQIALLCAFGVAALVATIALTRLGRSLRAVDLMERLGDTPAQLGIRFLIAVMLAFLALSSTLGFEAILGAFVGGVLLRVTDASGHLDDERFKAKVEGLGYGFLIPVFFVTSGLTFDLDALLESPANLVLVPVFLLALLVVRGIPAIAYRGMFTGRQMASAGLLQATSLSMIVIATQIGAELGTIDGGTSAGLLTAGIASVVIFPPLALRLLGNEELQPGWEEGDVEL